MMTTAKSQDDNRTSAAMSFQRPTPFKQRNTGKVSNVLAKLEVKTASCFAECVRSLPAGVPNFPRSDFHLASLAGGCTRHGGIYQGCKSHSDPSRGAAQAVPRNQRPFQSSSTECGGWKGCETPTAAAVVTEGKGWGRGRWHRRQDHSKLRCGQTWAHPAGDLGQVTGH